MEPTLKFQFGELDVDPFAGVFDDLVFDGTGKFGEDLGLGIGVGAEVVTLRGRDGEG